MPVPQEVIPAAQRTIAVRQGQLTVALDVYRRVAPYHVAVTLVV